MTLLYRVLYCSRNLMSGDADAVQCEIRSILSKSRANNERDGLTGGLLFSEGCFAQVLEGPIEAVERAFERIQCDDRHEEVTVLQSGPVEARDFPNWSMAFTGRDQFADPLDAAALKQAFGSRSPNGDAVLGILRGVVVREEDWLAPVA